MVELTPGQAWPIRPWDIAQRAWRENDAWYTGDTAALSRIYGQGAGVERATHMVRDQAYTGGLYGAVTSAARRAFWGRPVPLGEERSRLHIPAAADVSTLSSDLLFSRQPRIAYGKDDQVPAQAQKRLALIMGSDESLAQMQQGGEWASAFGAVALVPVWDRDLADHVWWEPVAADVVVPEFRMGRLVALNCWTELRDGNSATIYRHVARHEAGQILHTLYLGTDSNLGRVVPLADRPETAVYAPLVGKDGAEANAILTGVPELVAEWWLNAPAKQWRKTPQLAEAGRSDYVGGVKDAFDALDEAWSSWMRDLELAKARLVVPRAYLETRGRGRGATFDPDRSIYSPLDIPPGAAGQKAGDAIEMVQFDIRWEAHSNTTQALFRRILASVGLGELDKETASATDRTATEVNVGSQSRNRTRDRKALYARPALASWSRKLMLLDAAIFPRHGGGDYPLPEVVFPAAPDQTPLQTAQTIGLLTAAQRQSREVSVRMQHPEWGEDEVTEELRRLEVEYPPAADPTQVGRVGPEQDPEQDPEDQPPVDDTRS